jgi:hypothetical protein
MITVFRPQPNARSFIEPGSPLLWLFHWRFQPLSSPQPFDLFVIHIPNSISQQRRDPTIALPAKLPGQLGHVGHHSFFIGATDWHLTLRGSVLPQNAARAAFRDIQLRTNTINAGATTSGMRNCTPLVQAQ